MGREFPEKLQPPSSQSRQQNWTFDLTLTLMLPFLRKENKDPNIKREEDSRRTRAGQQAFEELSET